MQLCSTWFCYNIDEMQETNSCLCHLIYGEIDFIMCHFATVPTTYPGTLSEELPVSHWEEVDSKSVL